MLAKHKVAGSTPVARFLGMEALTAVRASAFCARACAGVSYGLLPARTPEASGGCAGLPQPSKFDRLLVRDTARGRLLAT